MEGDNTRQVCSKLNEKMDQVSIAQSECTIYKVHRQLRNVNPKAYEPEIIAIGPYHRDKDDLKMMEDHKLRYLRLLLEQRKENVENFVSSIGPLESRARESYAEPISLDTTEFIDMLVLDGCFIIELVRKYNRCYLRQKNDPIFRMHWITNSLQRDLILFENQIPFFVLCKLFDLIEVPGQHRRLTFLLLCFFDNLYPGKVPPDSTNVFSNDIKHLLDLMHRSWRPASFDSSENDPKEGKIFHISKVTRLREANVKFQSNEAPKGESPVNMFDLEFKNGTIFMPPLTIEDRTESLFRNLIVYEQYFLDSSESINFMTDYVKFLDCLIDSSKDVEILSRNGIIENWLGDDEVVAKTVNKLVDSVVGPGNRFIYAQIFNTVNEHCTKRWNRWMANFRRNYLNSPWAIISILVAVVLLLLTITQTLFTILQVV